MLSAIEAYIKEAETTAEELMDVQFLDTKFEDLTAGDLKVLYQYPSLEFVNFANVGLKTVSSHFPANAKISCLVFSNNQLDDSIVECLTNLTGLESLALDGNDIKSIEKFKLLLGLCNLREVSLDGNPITESTEDYRTKLFEMLPQLRIIDGFDKEGNEVEESDDFDEEDSEIDLAEFYGQDVSGEDESDTDDDELDEDDIEDEDSEGEEDEEDEDDSESDEEVESDSPSHKKARCEE